MINKVYPIALLLIALATVAGGGWAGWAWAVNATVGERFDALNAVVVENRVLIASNADRLALITYDRLLRKLRSQGQLSPRDLRAFCISASRLKIRHPACR